MNIANTTNPMRMTKQRLIILQELMKVTSHPTAYEVHEMVQKIMPNISLGTVYRNLEILSAGGYIQCLNFGTGKRRYDGNINMHYHLFCTSCGKVDDLPPELGIEKMLCEGLDGACGYKISGVSIKIFGTCSPCMNTKAPQNNILSIK